MEEEFKEHFLVFAGKKIFGQNEINYVYFDKESEVYNYYSRPLYKGQSIGNVFKCLKTSKQIKVNSLELVKQFQDKKLIGEWQSLNFVAEKSIQLHKDLKKNAKDNQIEKLVSELNFYLGKVPPNKRFIIKLSIWDKLLN